MSDLLFIGAHPDDIEIGCLGTILSLGSTDSVTLVIFSGNVVRREEFKNACAELSLLGVNIKRSEVYDFPDTELFQSKISIKKILREVIGLKFDRVYTHCCNDYHQDHRTIHTATREVYRSHEIFGYEIPKYDGNSFFPNVYFRLNEQVLEKKLKFLQTHYATQHDKSWYRSDVFRGLASLRGVEAGCLYAEAYEAYKIFEG